MELEEYYQSLFDSEFRENNVILERTVWEYIADLKAAALREEMDYFVAEFLEFCINLCRIEEKNGAFYYDSYICDNRGLQHTGIVFSQPQVLYPHRHNYFELVYVLSGCLKHRIADRELVLHRDDMLLLDLNTVHAEYVDEGSAVLYIHLPRKFVEAAVRDGNLAPELTSFFSADERKRQETFRYIYFEHHQGSFRIREMMTWIFRERLEGKPGSTYIVHGLLTRFLYLLGTTQEYVSQVYTEEEKGEAKIFRTLDGYLERLFWQIDSEKMERELHYSCNYLNKVVRRSTGLSLTDYCISKRLDYAAWLLINSEIPVGEIIDKCGYQNKTYFHRVFRNRFGQSPLEYRKEHAPKA